MSVSRQDFLARLDTLTACLSEPNLTDGGPIEYLRNQVAGMMRQGLAVLAFAAFESFIRARTAECLKSFNPDVISFTDLSEALQEAATIGATRGLLFRLKFEDPTKKNIWALKNLKAIASSDTSLITMSELAFASDKANLDEDDIPKILKSFGVGNPWPSITDVAKGAGMGGLLDAKAQFTAIKLTRHASAHEVTAGVPLDDLKNSLQTIRGLAVGFDMLLSHAVSVHNLGRIPGKASEPKIEARDVKFLFIAKLPNPANSFEIYRIEPPTKTSPASKVALGVFPSKLDALMYAVVEANVNQEQVIDVGAGGLVFDWHTW
jgi:hypothetical protein